jgi:O-antigen/teichoic acid export membrane protein
LFRDILRSRGKIVSVGFPVLVSQGTVAAWGLVGVILARVMPQDAFAAYSVSRSIEYFAGILGGGFVLQALLKFAAEGSGPREKRLLNASVLLTGGLSIAGALALFLGSRLIQSFYSDLDLRGVPELLAVVILTTAATGIAKNGLLAVQRTPAVMWGDLTTFVVRSGAVLLLAIPGLLLSPHQVFTAVAASNVIGMTVMLLLGGKLYARGAGTSAESIREVTNFSLLTLGTTFSTLIYWTGDVLMLGKLSSEAEVAAYSACRGLTSFAMTLNMAANLVLLPMASKMSRAGKGGVARRTWQGIVLIEAALIPFTLAIALFPVPILHLLFGGKYDHAWPVMVTLALGNLVRPVGSLFSSTASGAGKPVYSLVSVTAGALVMIVLNLLLIPSMGGQGAAISTAVSVVVSSAVVFILTDAFLKREAVGGSR